jgi:hypothetical protein
MYEDFLAILTMTPRSERRTSHTVAGTFATSTKKHRRMRGQVLLGPLVLTFPLFAVNDRHGVSTAPGPHPPGEPSVRPHQMIVVQQVIAVVVQAALMPPSTGRFWLSPFLSGSALIGVCH